MLDYTQAAFFKIIDDFKKFALIFNFVSQIFYIAYLIYAIATSNGLLAVNIVLLCLSIAYFIFFLIVTLREKQNKTVKAIVKKIFKYSKLAIKAVTLGITLYGLYYTSKNATLASVMLSALMIVGWLLQIAFEVITVFVESRINLLITGLQTDFDNFMKPIRAVSGFFKKAPVEEEEKELSPRQTKVMEMLGKRVAKRRAEREEKKLLKKQEQEMKKLQAKQQKREDKLTQKEAKKEEKRLKKEAKKEIAASKSEEE